MINCVPFTLSRPEKLGNTVYASPAPDMLTVMDSDTVDLVITSPPYAEKRKKTYGGIAADKYVEWFLPISAEILRVLKPTGSLVLNIKEGATNGERETYVYELVLAMKKQGWLWVDEFIWHKTNPFPTGNKRRLKDGFERCYHFAKTKNFKFFPDEVRTKSTSKWAGNNKKRDNKRQYGVNPLSGLKMSKRTESEIVRPSNVITMPSSCLTGIGHPAVFPQALPEFFIKLMTQLGDLVLDPFMGSGTTALAARSLGRRYEGTEKTEQYVELMARRLAAD